MVNQQKNNEYGHLLVYAYAHMYVGEHVYVWCWGCVQILVSLSLISAL